MSTHTTPSKTQHVQKTVEPDQFPSLKGAADSFTHSRNAWFQIHRRICTLRVELEDPQKDPDVARQNKQQFEELGELWLMSAHLYYSFLVDIAQRLQELIEEPPPLQDLLQKLEGIQSLSRSDCYGEKWTKSRINVKGYELNDWPVLRVVLQRVETWADKMGTQKKDVHQVLAQEIRDSLKTLGNTVFPELTKIVREVQQKPSKRITLPSTPHASSLEKECTTNDATSERSRGSSRFTSPTENFSSNSSLSLTNRTATRNLRHFKGHDKKSSKRLFCPPDEKSQSSFMCDRSNQADSLSPLTEVFTDESQKAFL